MGEAGGWVHIVATSQLARQAARKCTYVGVGLLEHGEAVGVQALSHRLPGDAFALTNAREVLRKADGGEGAVEQHQREAEDSDDEGGRVGNEPGTYGGRQTRDSVGQHRG